MSDFMDAEPAIERAGGVATIVLRRPAKRNRLTAHDLRVLQKICREISQDPLIRMVVLTAETAGQKRPVFCAGYDVGGFDEADHDPRLFENTVDCLARLPQVVLAVVNGSVYGGATDLVLACDMRIGLDSGEFRMPACALGLHYYPSGLRRYVKTLGLDLAKQAFLTAGALQFERLREAGVFLSLHGMSELANAGRELAQHIAHLAPMAVQMTKASLNEIGRGEADLDVLRAREAKSLASADFAEGRRAFAERRPPQFTGQ